MRWPCEVEKGLGPARPSLLGNCQGLGLGCQAVASAPYGFHHHAPRTQRLAQAFDVDVHRAFLDEDVVAPHLVEQLRAAVHPFGMFHQVVQQLEFGRAHLQCLRLEGHPVGARVQQQISDGDAVSHLLGCPAAQHGTDTRQQFLGGERLGDVVVCASVQPLYLVRLIATGGEHEDGHPLGTRVSAPFAGQGDATLAWQHPVEQDHVRQDGVQLTLGGHTIL